MLLKIQVFCVSPVFDSPFAEKLGYEQECETVSCKTAELEKVYACSNHW